MEAMKRQRWSHDAAEGHNASAVLGRGAVRGELDADLAQLAPPGAIASLRRIAATMVIAAVSSALRTARRLFFETGDPTYLAYTFYGDVNLKFFRSGRKPRTH